MLSNPLRVVERGVALTTGLDVRRSWTRTSTCGPLLSYGLEPAFLSSAASPLPSPDSHSAPTSPMSRAAFPAQALVCPAITDSRLYAIYVAGEMSMSTMSTSFANRAPAAGSPRPRRWQQRFLYHQCTPARISMSVQPDAEAKHWLCVCRKVLPISRNVMRVFGSASASKAAVSSVSDVSTTDDCNV